MRIVHVVYGLPMGGIETMLVNIANVQADLGHDIHIVVINDIIEQSLVARLDSKVTVHYLNRKKGSRNPLPVLRLNTTLFGIKPDVIHLHFASISRYILIPSLRKKLCVTLHTVCKGDTIRDIEKIGTIFAISDTVRLDIENRFGLKAITVYNGIDTSSFRCRCSYLPDSKLFKILQVGRLDSQHKGQDILLRAVSIIIKLGYNVTATFIGDGISRQRLEELSRELGIEKSVDFIGRKSQEYVSTHISDYDLFVHPSRFEGFGLVVAEAMAAGVPVLVSDIDGPMEIIENGKCGYSFRSEDYNDCANKIIEIINNYPPEEKIKQACQRINTEFNVRVTALKYLSYYKNLIK